MYLTTQKLLPVISNTPWIIYRFTPLHHMVKWSMQLIMFLPSKILAGEIISYNTIVNYFEKKTSP
jgi:hypothetical protein